MNTLCSQRKNSHGFTLIELMIVVAIVGVLAGVAVPAYSDYVRRGNVTDLVSAISEAKLRVEQRYADNRSYAGTLCGDSAVTIPNSTTTATYVITCVTPNSGSNQTYTITGTGSGTIAGFVYTVNEAGTKASTVGSIWGGASVTGRWIMKNGG